ncbi:Zinc/iron permease, partial [Rhodotorula sp. JG-1b]
RVGLRVGAIFVILVTSVFGTMFPILSKRVPFLRRAIPGSLFDFVKFFGSGVILAYPSTEALGGIRSEGGCLDDAWGDYPYAFGLCLLSLFLTFVTQMVAFRLGTEALAKLGNSSPPHVHVMGHPGHVQEQDRIASSGRTNGSEDETAARADSLEKGKLNSVICLVREQIMGVATLEFGVCLHSVIIGLTLAVTEDSGFDVLFIVIIFHQMFEGLGLGTRLAFLRLERQYSWIPWLGACLYSLCTPIGMAIGLGVREGLNMNGATASVTSGVLDGISSGILLYTALVELIAHEFIFNKLYHTCSWLRLWFSLGAFAIGAGLMALLGKWA